MGLDVYYPADIRNALCAAEHSASAAIDAGGNDNYQAAYLAGYRAAIVTIGLAFGLVQQQGGKHGDHVVSLLARTRG